ncbi:MAG: DUF350 domain-containing protein [Actinomycetota bacterium]|nr:DUF350 domain-containing protein [Actinomycetota bacterium]
MLRDTALDVAAILAYSLVGTVLMVVGYVLVDVLTPGRLGDLIWRERNRNAALVVASGLLGTGLVVVVAILTSEDELVRGLITTVTAGLVGIALMGVAFVVVDALTPGDLGETLCEREPHPAAWVTAAAHLAIAGIVAAALS